VIVDLAASSGGNCELTEDNATIERYGVTIIGESNLPSSMSMSTCTTALTADQRRVVGGTTHIPPSRGKLTSAQRKMKR